FHLSATVSPAGQAVHRAVLGKNFLTSMSILALRPLPGGALQRNNSPQYVYTWRMLAARSFRLELRSLDDLAPPRELLPHARCEFSRRAADGLRVLCRKELLHLRTLQRRGEVGLNPACHL